MQCDWDTNLSRCSLMYSHNQVSNKYVLFDEIIPVQKDEKWGLYNIDGTKKSYKTIMGIKSSFIQTKKNSTALPSEKAIFISKMDRIFTTIIETDKSLRKQKDDDYQSQQIKKDQFGISYEAIGNMIKETLK